MRIEYLTHTLYLKNTFTSARSSLSKKEIGIIRVFDIDTIGIGEISPIHTFGETIPVCSNQLNEIEQVVARFTVPDAISWLRNNSLKYFPSVIYGFETALIDLQSRQAGLSTFEFLNLPNPNGKQSCITIPINYNRDQIDKQLDGFSYNIVKVKLSKDFSSDLNKIQYLVERTKQKLWIDAECLFTSSTGMHNFIKEVGLNNILFIEDPFSFEPNKYWLDLTNIIGIYVDRFFTNHTQITKYGPYVSGFNVKPIRFGLRNSISIINHLKKLNKKTILGCLLESGISISNSFVLAGIADYIDLDGYTFFEENPAIGIHWNTEGINYINNHGNGIM